MQLDKFGVDILEDQTFDKYVAGPTIVTTLARWNAPCMKPVSIILPQLEWLGADVIGCLLQQQPLLVLTRVIDTGYHIVFLAGSIRIWYNLLSDKYKQMLNGGAD